MKRDECTDKGEKGSKKLDKPDREIMKTVKSKIVQ